MVTAVTLMSRGGVLAAWPELLVGAGVLAGGAGCGGADWVAAGGGMAGEGAGALAGGAGDAGGVDSWSFLPHALSISKPARVAQYSAVLRA
jgi:hypothetical protein